MHTPAHFEESRLSALHSLMRAHPFAALVALTPGGIDAEHLPLLLLEAGDSPGVLQGHVARANPFCRELGDDSEVLAVFQGPNRYVSPNWYPSKRKHGRVVPTWNYLVVHARGRITWHRDPVWLRTHLENATKMHEDPGQPWQLSDAPAEFIERMLAGIVGFEISISDLKGKWKLSQNRNEEDRLGVIAGLKGQSNAFAAEMVDWMTDRAGHD